MAKVASKGLARAAEIYENREKRIREVKEEGKKVFGYMCLYPVIEILTAADVVPYRILGNMNEPITEGDNFLSPLVCPFIRSCLDLALKGKYDFLDGTNWAHTCDMATNLNQVWKTVIKTPNPNFTDTPHSVHELAVEEHKRLLANLQDSIGNFAGKTITRAALKKAIKLHNQQRALVREMYDLRKPDPPLMTGAETLKVIKAIMSLPIEEGNQLLRETIDEVKNRKTGKPQKKSSRLFIWGPVIDNTAFIDMIENLDANVVMDDMCVGSRAFYPDVPLTDDPLEGLAYHYQVNVKCPRTYYQSFYGENKHDYMTDMNTRYAYIKEYLKDWNVNGAILQAMMFCDIHAYEIPGIKEYLSRNGVPSIYLEQDYSEASLAQFRTRVQGFIEVLGKK